MPLALVDTGYCSRQPGMSDACPSGIERHQLSCVSYRCDIGRMSWSQRDLKITEKKSSKISNCKLGRYHKRLIKYLGEDNRPWPKQIFIVVATVNMADIGTAEKSLLNLLLSSLLLAGLDYIVYCTTVYSMQYGTYAIMSDRLSSRICISIVCELNLWWILPKIRTGTVVWNNYLVCFY